MLAKIYLALAKVCLSFLKALLKKLITDPRLNHRVDWYAEFIGLSVSIFGALELDIAKFKGDANRLKHRF